MGKYFGTDGVRGIANTELDAGLAYRLGYGLAWDLAETNGRPARILIGWDTRISGTMLTASLCAGITAAGGSAKLLGTLPTPGVARAVVADETADAGIVVSASHNPFEHNGLKVFGPDGYKLSDQQEERLEHYLDALPEGEKKTGAALGTVEVAFDQARQDYVRYVADTSPCAFNGLHVAVDCANGAASATAPLIFTRLGAVADFLSNSPDGININENCGSTHLEQLQEKMRTGRYDIGVAFDGDADRCLLVDETGEVIDGDAILGVLAEHLQSQNKLKGAVAVTVMSNLGLHSFLQERGIETHVTKVGDRYVLEDMVQTGGNLGGEQSGHVILLDNATTGDGELTAVQFLAVLKQSGKTASQLANRIPKFPQVLHNVPVPREHKASVASMPAVKALEAEIREIFGTEGRILIRPSGTEALVRVMVEGKDRETVEALAAKAAEIIRVEAAKL